MAFHEFKVAVQNQFARMSKHHLFRTDTSKDVLWKMYLSSFPAGANPFYRERTEHDCNCCKNFIRNAGNVVAIIDGKLETIWDVAPFDLTAGSIYAYVAEALAAYVSSKAIANRFLHFERKVGVDKNFEQRLNNEVKAWEHFSIVLPAEYVVTNRTIDQRLGESRALHDVLLRSLHELTIDSVDTVLELISQNSLYRGEEHRATLLAFKALQEQTEEFQHDWQFDRLAWLSSISSHAAVSKIRNTSVGTLLVDLSNGVELDQAVSKFEAMVAPTNYKRPTALVTKSMVDAAKLKIEELGLTASLQRRYATKADLSINNSLFVDRKTSVIDDNVFASIPIPEKVSSRVAEMSIEAFIKDVLPTALEIELLVENRLTNNLVSLLTAEDPTATPMFKWSNPFSWSYVGDVTDSIKERVKNAGGNVTGEFCCRLAWSNFDDLDLSMVEPDGNTVYFWTRSRNSACGGRLDVDMNAGGGTTRNPVENIVYASKANMRKGVYRLVVHQYSQRETKDVGFEVEIEGLGLKTSFNYHNAVKQGERITVATMQYDDNVMTLVDSLPPSRAAKEIWGVTTETFQKVTAVMRSPNYWDETVRASSIAPLARGIGNEHIFFMLQGCKNDGTARGFYNEFLRSDLDVHRKVLEVVGSKLRAAGDEQLSGLGFSTTQRNTATLRVKGKVTRDIRVTF